MQPTDNSNDKASILKATREAKGLTLEIVHEATKIPMDVLRAIEEGYSVRILTPFYYRGFIKIYAEFLGLDVKEMYTQHGLDQPAPKPLPSVPVSPVKTTRKAMQPPQPNVFLEQMQEGFAFVFKPKTLKLIFKIIGFLLLLFLFFKMAGCVASHMHKKGASSNRQSLALMQERNASTPQEMNHQSVQAPSDDNKVEIAVRASRDIWLLVRVDGHVVFETTLSKGSMESWSGDDRIELSGGDLELLDMEVNGRHIGSLGGGERRIRKVLITPEGLTVKK